MPQLPAVGAATILPMQALVSDTAMARVMAQIKVSPIKLLPIRWLIFQASPPVRPLAERTFRSMPAMTDSFMTCRLWAMRSYTSS